MMESAFGTVEKQWARVHFKFVFATVWNKILSTSPASAAVKTQPH